MIEIRLTDRAAGGPLYAQVRAQIEDGIREGRIAAGELLPSPAALAQKLSMDRGEVQRAYFELEQSGLVSKSVGKDFLGKEKVTYTVK
ncbi:MAG TPA: GntR family transcriptional regulator [Pyrinomonadaceae bacterium]|nr:GntR family transcriptional regulator [Pyrinomonadaceae bacterium]